MITTPRVPPGGIHHEQARLPKVSVLRLWAADCTGGAPKAGAPYRNRAAELCNTCGPANAYRYKVTSGGGVVCSMNVPANKQTLYCEEAMGDILGHCVGGGHSGGG
ncbi:hypothetical protein EsH8_X_000640 [Colletotrichum jinshuiense]